ncbi:hypothetical protein ACQRXC_29360 (plasmid) [Niallia taxi]|uniref:hypothetical protein n=1 Tax=Niallia taxi TaxID=2499688 RepID=UPI003F62001F
MGKEESLIKIFISKDFFISMGILLGLTIAGCFAIDYQLQRKDVFDTNVYNTLTDYFDVDEENITFKYNFASKPLENPEFFVRVSEHTYKVIFNDKGKGIKKITET